MPPNSTQTVPNPTPSQPKLAPSQFHLKVYSPLRLYFEGDADSVSAVNDTGPFDVLAQHHNFITLLNPCDLVIRTKDQKDRVIPIARGIMQVKTNDVVVFLDV
jgi:F-type H+-transporting ATPase subunit epsilon